MTRAATATTRNPRAAFLIAQAQAKCIGCRVNWRLKTGTFLHPAPFGATECWAMPERKELRDIAASRKETK